MHAYGLRNRFYYYVFILACSALLPFSPLLGQDIPINRVLTYDATFFSIDTTVFGSNIQVEVKNDTIRTAFYKALSYYPELWDKKIRLKYGRTNTSMNAKPRILSLLFRKKDNRSYKITIGNREGHKPAMLVSTASFNALVGVLGHEIAHILDYTDMSGWKVVDVGVKYVFSKKYRRQMEYYTDSLAMSKGLQWQVYDYSYHVVYDADIDDDYRQYKLAIYMSPELVRDLAVRMDSLQNIPNHPK